MSSGQADVLVEMKGFYFLPVDAGRLRQCVKELELGGSGRGYDAGMALLSDRAPNGRCGLFGGGPA
jgi:hypothetical protein